MMECNKDEALRAKVIAEKKMQSNDFEGALKIAMKAQRLFPELENISQLLIVCNVHCAAQNKILGSEKDLYGIFQLDNFADEVAIKKQYRKLALTLHPDKNKLPGAEAAFKLIGEANAVLMDPGKKVIYDSKCKISLKTAQAKPPSNQFCSVNRNQTTPSKFQETFCTTCPNCSFKVQYLKIFVNHVLPCQRCFAAYELGKPHLEFMHPGKGGASEVSASRSPTQSVPRKASSGKTVPPTQGVPPEARSGKTVPPTQGVPPKASCYRTPVVPPKGIPHTSSSRKTAPPTQGVIPKTSSSKTVPPTQGVPPKASFGKTVPPTQGVPPKASSGKTVPPAQGVPSKASRCWTQVFVFPPKVIPHTGSSRKTAPPTQGVPPKTSSSKTVPPTQSVPPKASFGKTVPPTQGVPPKASSGKIVPPTQGVPPKASRCWTQVFPPKVIPHTGSSRKTTPPTQGVSPKVILRKTVPPTQGVPSKARYYVPPVVPRKGIPDIGSSRNTVPIPFGYSGSHTGLRGSEHKKTTKSESGSVTGSGKGKSENGNGNIPNSRKGRESRDKVVENGRKRKRS